MKFTHIVAAGAAVAALAVSACNMNNNNTANTSPTAPSPPTAPVTPTPPPPATGQSLDTAAVLAQARVTSETASPYAVNSGALTLTDTSDTTGALTVN